MRTHYHSYKDLIDSFKVINAMHGILPFGIYSGFDTIENGLTIGNARFAHTTTGSTFTLKNGTQLSPMAVIRTKQGVIITEDDTIELPISANSNPSPRYDVLVLSHEWADIQGGSVSTFSIVEGTAGSGIPTIPTANTKVAIGIIRVVQGEADVSNWTWQRYSTPSFGNHDILQAANVWQSQQSLTFGDTPLSITNETITIPKTGNNFYVNLSADTILSFVTQRLDPISQSQNRVGTQVFIINSSNHTITLSQGATPPDGTKGLAISDDFAIGAILGPHGIMSLIEDVNEWKLVSLFDTYSNNYRTAKNVEDKDWIEDDNFIAAVKGVIVGNDIAHSKATNALTLTNGVIQNGIASTHKNVYEVTVNAAEITGIQTAFAVGTKVTFKFNLSTGYSVVRQGSGATGFKSPIGFDYEVRNGSIIEGIQLADGFHVLQGEPHIEWTTVPLGSNAAAVDSLPTPRYAFHPDGTLRFQGVARISGQFSFTVPSAARFRNTGAQMGGLFNNVTVQPYIAPQNSNPTPFDPLPTEYHYMIYAEDMVLVSGNFVSEGTFTFLIDKLSSDTGIPSIVVNLNGLKIPYK